MDSASLLSAARPMWRNYCIDLGKLQQQPFIFLSVCVSPAHLGFKTEPIKV